MASTRLSSGLAHLFDLTISRFNQAKLRPHYALALGIGGSTR